MNLRQDQIQDAITNLPKATPRPGLKHEMLQSILSEVRQEETEAPKKRKFSLRIPPLGFSMSVAGFAVAVFVMLQSMDLPLNQPEENLTDANLRHGAAPLNQTQLTKQLEQEIQARKAEREKRLQKQVIPHYNGQFIGEGVEIRIRNSEAYLLRKSISPSDIEANFDIYRLVQEIYTNGGQIVSINGLLVDPYTQIVTKGTLMEVSERRVTFPLTIKVVGDSQTLMEKFDGGSSVLEKLKVEPNQAVTVEQKDLVAVEDMEETNETDK